MRPDLRAAVVLGLLACAIAVQAQAPQLDEPSLRAPLEPLQDATGEFVLTLELDPLAGETLASAEFSIELGVTVAPSDALFTDSFESN